MHTGDFAASGDSGDHVSSTSGSEFMSALLRALGDDRDTIEESESHPVVLLKTIAACCKVGEPPKTDGGVFVSLARILPYPFRK